MVKPLFKQLVGASLALYRILMVHVGSMLDKAAWLRRGNVSELRPYRAPTLC